MFVLLFFVQYVSPSFGLRAFCCIFLLSSQTTIFRKKKNEFHFIYTLTPSPIHFSSLCMEKSVNIGPNTMRIEHIQRESGQNLGKEKEECECVQVKGKVYSIDY